MRFYIRFAVKNRSGTEIVLTVLTSKFIIMHVTHDKGSNLDYWTYDQIYTSELIIGYLTSNSLEMPFWKLLHVISGFFPY